MASHSASTTRETDDLSDDALQQADEAASPARSRAPHLNQVLGQELERNQPPELEVLRLVHHTDTATTKQLRDSIV